MADLSNTLGAETLGRYINLDDAIKKFAVANGIDTAGLIKSEEQIQQEAQAQQQASFNNLQDPRVLTKAGETLSNAGATVNQKWGTRNPTRGVNYEYNKRRTHY